MSRAGDPVCLLGVYPDGSTLYLADTWNVNTKKCWVMRHTTQHNFYNTFNQTSMLVV
jgi:sugar lactone lactonase YvrE